VSSLGFGESINRTFAVTVGDVVSGTVLHNNDYRVSCAEDIAQGGSPVDTVVHTHAPIVQVHTRRVDDTSGNNNGRLDPGEQDVNLYVTLTNVGDATATNVTAILTPTTPGVTVSTNQAAYADVGPGAMQESITPYVLDLAHSLAYGIDLDFELQINTDQGVFTDTLSLTTALYDVFLPLVLRN